MHRLFLLFAGQGAAALLIMARNLCLARLIGLDGYGSAMAIVMALAIVELLTNLGIPQQIVSQKNGARPQVQATLHSAQILRGIVGALALLLAAKPLAIFLNAPDLAWMFAISALSPLVLGFIHLDVFRAQRHRRHVPQIMLLVIPAGLAFFWLWPFRLWLDDAQLMLVLIAVQSSSTVVMSHLIAKRRYCLAWRSKQALTLLKYGLPLAGNGALLCAVLHLEKLIAGHVLGINALALVAMGAALTMTPALTAARSFQAYHLPILRRTQHNNDMMSDVLQRGFVFGSVLAISIAAISPLILELIGPSFVPVHTLLPLFVALAAIRLPKSALATIALSTGRTHIPIFANAPRLLAAPALWWVAVETGSLWNMLLVALAAEGAGMLTGMFAIRKDAGIPKIEVVTFAFVCALLVMGQTGTAAILLCASVVQSALGRYAKYRQSFA